MYCVILFFIYMMLVAWLYIIPMVSLNYKPCQLAEFFEDYHVVVCFVLLIAVFVIILSAAGFRVFFKSFIFGGIFLQLTPTVTFPFVSIVAETVKIICNSGSFSDFCKCFCVFLLFYVPMIALCVLGCRNTLKTKRPPTKAALSATAVFAAESALFLLYFH